MTQVHKHEHKCETMVWPHGCVCIPGWVKLSIHRYVFIQPSLETDSEKEIVLCTHTHMCTTSDPLPCPECPAHPGWYDISAPPLMPEILYVNGQEIYYPGI